MAQKNAFVIYLAAEAWNLAEFLKFVHTVITKHTNNWNWNVT
jgi:hypothetical protein